MKKVVVYGGAFSPPHLGHAAIIENVLRYFPCNEIWVMPSADRYDKKITASADHRLQMLAIIIQELFPNPIVPIKISSLEIEQKNPATTYRTKLLLEKLYPENQFYFLVGSDIFPDIEKSWTDGKELFATANFLVVKRPGFNLPETVLNVHVLKSANSLNISSTTIRNLIQNGHTTLPHLSQGVALYIKEKNLYNSKRK